MFSPIRTSNAYTSTAMNISLDRIYLHRFDAFKKVYDPLINEVITAMLRDQVVLQKVLISAADEYLKIHKPNSVSTLFGLLRADGRKRAIQLKERVARATDATELVLALSEAIKAGNEEHDSLKTILFNHIYFHFIKRIKPNNFRILDCSKSIGSVLKELVNNANIKLMPVEMKTIK